MRKSPRQKRCRGWLMTEGVVGVTLLVVVMAMASGGIARYADTRDEYRWRQVALHAAEAQLERIRAGAAVDSRPPTTVLAPEIVLTVEVTPGTGEWAGFELVEVQATADLSPRRQYRELVKAYIPADDLAGGVAPGDPLGAAALR